MVHNDTAQVQHSAAVEGNSASETSSLPGQLAGGDEFPKAVLRDAQAGSPAAFADIFRAYDPALRSLAFRLLGDRETAQDALQEAWLAAFRGLPSFDHRSTLKTWLFRVAYRAILRHGRRRPDQWTALAPDSRLESSTPDHADAVAARRDVAAALALLPPEQRAALLLVDREGFTYAAAADVLGVATGTVASRLHAGRAALRRSLAAHRE